MPFMPMADMLPQTISKTRFSLSDDKPGVAS